MSSSFLLCRQQKHVPNLGGEKSDWKSILGLGVLRDGMVSLWPPWRGICGRWVNVMVERYLNNFGDLGAAGDEAQVGTASVSCPSWG